MRKNKSLLEQYLIDVNTLHDDVETHKVIVDYRKLSNNLDKYMVYILSFCIGIMTVWLVAQEAIMKLGVYLK